MENIQINGQRIWGPPSDWSGPPPPHGTEIFIKNIPGDVLEMELYLIFSSVGTVYEVRLPVHWSGINRGYAFVRFTSVAEANAAIQKFDKFPIRVGRNLKVERSIDNTRLFLSAVPNTKTGEGIMKDLLTVVDNVKTVYVYPARENPSSFRGYAFVEFNSHRDAAIAKRILTPDICFNLFEKKCIAAWANPLPFLNQDILETINILFMRNIPKDMKSVTVKKAIEILIVPDTIQKVKRMNDFAFLTFRNHDSAKRAMHIIKSNSFLFGPQNEIQIEWAVPRELASAVSFDMKENETPEPKFYPQRGNEPIKNFRAEQLLTIQDYAKFYNLNLTDHQKNFQEFKFTRNEENMKVLKGTQRKFGSTSSFNKIQVEENIYNKKTRKEIQVPKLFGLPSSLSPNNFNCHEVTFRNECMDDAGDFRNPVPFGEFCIPETEESYKSLHVKQWFESLVCSPCTSSPTLTNSSADSPTNMSWKCDEGQGRFFGGDCYDSKSFDGKMGGVAHI